MTNPIIGTVPLTAGQTSVPIKVAFGGGQPVGAVGTVMRQGSSSAVIASNPDWKNMSSSSVTFYLASAIPSDGTNYKFFYALYLNIP